MKTLALRLAPWALYGLLWFVSFLPQSLHLANSVAYVGDGLESVYIVDWNVHQLFHSPLRLFEANVLHPNRHALALTDHRLLPSLSVAPIVWATGNPVLATNVAVAFACLLAAAAGRRLGLTLGLEPVGAWAAGALYGFHTYQVHESSRLNIVSHGFLAFALERLVVYLRHGRPRDAAAVAGLLLLQGLSSNYHLLYGVVLLGLVLAGITVLRPRLVLQRLPRLALCGVAAALLFVPMAWSYLEVARWHGYERALPGSMGLEHFVTTAPGNLIYGSIGAEIRTQQRGPHFVGFVSMILALASIPLAARARRPRGEAPAPATWVLGAAGLALVFVLLSLGRNIVLGGMVLGPGPYRLLYALPGFQLVRIPERFALLAMLFVGLLAGYTISVVRWRGFMVAACLLAVLVPLEHVSPAQPWEAVPVTRAVPDVYRWLARDGNTPVAEVPVRSEALVRRETLEMYFSTVHRRPIIHGYTAYPPQITRLLRRVAAQFPSEAALQGLARVGVDTVLVHRGRAVGSDLEAQLSPRATAEQRSKAMRFAALDLYDQLPDAVARGRISLLTRFESGRAVVYDATSDEVYRILPAPRAEAAPQPSGRVLPSGTWQAHARSGDPALALDGDPRTSWSVVEPLLGDETLEVVFDRPTVVSGMRLPLSWSAVYPTRFRVDGLDTAGVWTPLARFNQGQTLQLLDALLRNPRQAAMGFAFGERTLSGIRLAIESGGTSFDGWTVPEVEVLGP